MEMKKVVTFLMLIAFLGVATKPQSISAVRELPLPSNNLFEALVPNDIGLECVASGQPCDDLLNRCCQPYFCKLDSEFAGVCTPRP